MLIMNDPYTLLKEAAEHLRSKNYQEAGALYDKLGRTYAKRNEYRKALSAFEKSLELFPHVSLYIIISEIHHKLHHVDAAIKTLTQALHSLSNTDPESPQISEIKNKLKALHAGTPQNAREITTKQKLQDAELLIEEKLFEEAKEIYQTVLKENPHDPSAHKAIASLEEKKASWFGKEEVEAADDVIRALERDLGLETSLPEEHLISTSADNMDIPPETIYELSIGYHEMGLHKDAIDHLRRALAKTNEGPLHWDCLLLLGDCLRETGDIKEAIDALEKALALNLSRSYQHAIYYKLALAYEAEGNFNKALTALRKIERTNKKYRDIEQKIKKVRKKITHK